MTGLFLFSRCDNNSKEWVGESRPLIAPVSLHPLIPAEGSFGLRPRRQKMILSCGVQMFRCYSFPTHVLLSSQSSVRWWSLSVLPFSVLCPLSFLWPQCSSNRVWRSIEVKHCKLTEQVKVHMNPRRRSTQFFTIIIAYFILLYQIVRFFFTRWILFFVFFMYNVIWTLMWPLTRDASQSSLSRRHLFAVPISSDDKVQHEPVGLNSTVLMAFPCSHMSFPSYIPSFQLSDSFCQIWPLMLILLDFHWSRSVCFYM